MTASLAVQYSASSPSRQTFTSPEKIAVSVRKTDSLASNMTHSPDEAPSARARRHAFTLDRRTALAKPDACQSELAAGLLADHPVGVQLFPDLC